MKLKAIWLAYFLLNYIRKVVNYVMGKLKFKLRLRPLVNQNLILDVNSAHDAIKKLINSGKPAMVARFGGNEAQCTAEALGIDLGMRRRFRPKTLRYMCMNAGLFPMEEQMAMRFANILHHAAEAVDLLGFWSSFMQDYLVHTICPQEMQLTFLEDLEAYNSNQPWTSALRNKKVLVIHPFKKTIESQYKKRKLLFENPDVLPEFDLTVLQAVQTIAGEKDERFCDWEEALNYMYTEAMKIDFDVAIIGCGAYGMPLAAKIKNGGRIAIHLGGATQLLFGIKGARWDNYKTARLYNEHWVRPSVEETPRSSKSVEGACYW